MFTFMDIVHVSMLDKSGIQIIFSLWLSLRNWFIEFFVSTHHPSLVFVFKLICILLWEKISWCGFCALFFSLPLNLLRAAFTLSCTRLQSWFLVWLVSLSVVRQSVRRPSVSSSWVGVILQQYPRFIEWHIALLPELTWRYPSLLPPPSHFLLSLLFIIPPFLVACTRLYDPLCPSVGRLVGLLVGPSIHHALLFFVVLSLFKSF